MSEQNATCSQQSGNETNPGVGGNHHADDAKAEQERQSGQSLTRPGVSRKTLADAQIRHVTAGMTKGLVGWSVAGLAIPYFNLDGRPLEVNGKPFYRIRLDQPTSDMKYSQARASGDHAYIPPALKGMKIGSTLFIPEGEFKALSLCEAGFPAVWLSNGWQSWLLSAS